MTRVESILYGPDDDPSRGHVTQVHEMRRGLGKLETLAERLQWLILAGVVVGLLNLIMPRSGASSGPSNQTTSIMTSDAAAKASADLASHRDWLTVAQVAQRESVTERAITEWINAGRLQPQPVKDGKSWRISPSYRMAPKSAAPLGTMPSGAETAKVCPD